MTYRRESPGTGSGGVPVRPAALVVLVLAAACRAGSAGVIESRQPAHGHEIVGATASARAGGPTRTVGLTETLRADVAVATLDTAWSLINTTYFDSTFGGLRWTEVRDRLRPDARAARTLPALREVIQRMLDTLGQSHLRLWERERVDTLRMAGSAPAGTLGIDVRLRDGDVVITRVDPGSSAWIAGVRPGWAVDSVDGRPVMQQAGARTNKRAADTRSTWRSIQAQFAGPPGSRVRVAVRDFEDRTVCLSLEFTVQRGVMSRTPNLPRRVVRVAGYSVPPEGRSGLRTVGVIAFDQWLAEVAPPLDSIVDGLRASCGLVIDLRGNTGGLASLVTGFAGYFVDSATTLGSLRTREASLRDVAVPRRLTTIGTPAAPFRGPIVVVVDRITASASEVFAGGLQAAGRVLVIGDTTAGAVLPSVLDRLPTGDVLQHPIADFATPGGVRLEGRGVIPDVVLNPTRRDYVSDPDPILSAAVKRLGGC